MLQKMTSSQQPFSKVNFLMIGICCVLIIIGFLLMAGGGSSVENGFNPDIFSTRRIVVGPLIAFLGFLLLAFAILADPKEVWKKMRGKNKSKSMENAEATETKDSEVTVLKTESPSADKTSKSKK